MKTTNKIWTVKHLDTLRNEYPECSNLSALASKLEKSLYQLYKKASELNIKRVSHSKPRKKKTPAEIIEPITTDPDILPEETIFLTVEELEQEIESLGRDLLNITDRRLWSKKVDRYNYLCFKHSQISKDNPETKVKPSKIQPEKTDIPKPEIKIIMEQPKTKTCKKCNEDKPLDQYQKHSASKDGLQIYCRQCRSKKNITPTQKISIIEELDLKTGTSEKPVQLVTKGPNLDIFSSEELMKELHKRGYEGILTYTAKVDIAQIGTKK